LRPYTASYLVAFDPAWGFVAVPSALSTGGASFIWSSPDGIEWMWGNQVVSYGNTLVATNGIFLSAGGTDSVYSSHDGGNRWASIPTKSYTNTPTVIGQTFFIPVGDTEVYTSADGINLNLYHSASKQNSSSVIDFTYYPPVSHRFLFLRNSFQVRQNHGRSSSLWMQRRQRGCSHFC
jgi:hypothetical protein